jgi:hypothetical protein
MNKTRTSYRQRYPVTVLNGSSAVPGVGVTPPPVVNWQN